MRKGTPWWLPLLALALGAAAAFASDSPRQAGAHALLVRADPPVNAQLREPPAQLTLYFSEPLERRFSGVRVVDQKGARVDERVEFDPADDAAMRVVLKPLSPGFITVYWETVSTVDGHRITGSYPLTILNPDGSQPAGQPAAVGVQVEGTELKPQRVIDKLLLLLGGALLTGAFVFVAWVTPALPGAAGTRARGVMEQRALAMAAAALVVLAAAGAAELLLQAADLGAGAGDALETRWGRGWLLRNAVLALPVGGLVILWAAQGAAARRLGAALGVAGALVYLGATASVSHAAAGTGAFWGAASDFVHLLAASVWIGMLAPLTLLFLWAQRGLSRGERFPVLATALQRFSILALLSVALLMVSGAVNAVIEVGRLADLLQSGYGRALLVKLLLLLPLLGIAGANAYLLRPRLVEEAEAGRRDVEALVAEEARLSRTLVWELGAAIAVLAAVAVLVQLTPTRAKLATPTQGAGKYTETLEREGISATLVIDPNEPGINTFEVYLTGAVDTVESVRLQFVSPGGLAGDRRLILDATNPPTLYVGRGPYLTEAGRWQVIVDIRRTTQDMALRFPVRVGGAVAETAPRSGGAFAAPLEASLPRLALVAGAVVLAALVVGLSLRPAGIVGGYLSLWAEAAAEQFSGRRLGPVASLAVLLAVGIGLGAVVGAHVHGGPGEDTGENPIEASAESIARGEMLFLTLCSQCHGETGRGDGPLASSLKLPPANLYLHVPYHPDAFFFRVITNGLAGVMPGFKEQLSEEDRWHILNFLRARFGQQPAAQ